MKAMVHFRDKGTDFFDIIAEIFQEDTLALYLFILCQDNVLQTFINLMKENGFTLKKTRSRWYLTETMTDGDYTDDLVLLSNTPAQIESLLHSLEQAVEGIGLCVNTNKTEYMCFKQKRSHLHSKRPASKISGPVHTPQQQHLICWKWY